MKCPNNLWVSKVLHNCLAWLVLNDSVSMLVYATNLFWMHFNRTHKNDMAYCSFLSWLTKAASVSLCQKYHKKWGNFDNSNQEVFGSFLRSRNKEPRLTKQAQCQIDDETFTHLFDILAFNGFLNGLLFLFYISFLLYSLTLKLQ